MQEYRHRDQCTVLASKLSATGDDRFECQECYGAAIGGVVIIATMVTVGISCCLSLNKKCCASCCSQGKDSFVQYLWTMEIIL